MSGSANITDKKYKRLLLQVGLNGFSYCIVDTLQKVILDVKEIDFTSFSNTLKVEEN